jgi:hypothetical protein
MTSVPQALQKLGCRKSCLQVPFHQRRNVMHGGTGSAILEQTEKSFSENTPGEPWQKLKRPDSAIITG